MDNGRASAPPPYESVVHTQPMYGPAPVHYSQVPGSATYYVGPVPGPGGIPFASGPQTGGIPPPIGVQFTPGPQPTAQPGVRMVTVVQVGSERMMMICPMCQADIQTSTELTPGILPWVSCGALAFFGFFLCCCVPFCIPGCQDVKHTCPNCKAHIGTYNRI